MYIGILNRVSCSEKMLSTQQLWGFYIFFFSEVSKTAKMHKLGTVNSYALS